MIIISLYISIKLINDFFINSTKIIPEIMDVNDDESMGHRMIYPNSKNSLIGYLQSLNIGYSTKEIEYEYKKFIYNLHFQLNSLGFKTDCNGINDLEIRVLNTFTTHYVGRYKNSELCKGFIISKMQSWIQHMKPNPKMLEGKIIYSHDPEKNKTELLRIIRNSSGHERCGKYSFITHYKHLERFFESKFMYDKKYIKNIMDNIKIELKSLEYVNYVMWEENYSGLTCLFKDASKKDQFEKEFVNILSKHLENAICELDLIKSWFEHPFMSQSSNFDILYVPKITYRDNKYYANLYQGNNESLNSQNLLKIFKNISYEKYIEICEKYFNQQDFDNIVINSIHGMDGILDLADIRAKYLEFIDDLDKLNISKS